MRIRRTAAGATLLLMLPMAACSGPEVPAEVSMKDYSTDIVYGSQTKPQPPPPPIPAADLAPAFPGFIAPPPPLSFVAGPAPRSVSPPTTTRPVACPEDDPLTFPKAPATAAVAAPPGEGAYRFRQQGTFKIDRGQAQALPTASVRAIRRPVRLASGELTYDVVIESLGDVTTTSYAVRQNTGEESADGVFITRVVTRRASGSVEEFSPTRGVRIIALPAARDVTWNDVGTDPLRATSMVVQGVIVDKGRVNACGEPLDAWTVRTTGRLLGPGKDLTVTATYQVGTQFGGLVLADDVTISGMDNGRAVELRTKATIDSVRPDPLPPTSTGKS